MSSYKNNKDGTLTPTSSNLQVNQENTEQYVTEGELVEALAEKQDIIQYATMPTASALLLGNIVQYVGDTTKFFTSGHFYKCVAKDTLPISYVWEKVTYSSDDIIIPSGVSTLYDINHFLINSWSSEYYSLSDGVLTCSAPLSGNRWPAYYITDQELVDYGLNCTLKVNVRSITEGAAWFITLIYPKTDGSTGYFDLGNLVATGEYIYNIDLSSLSVYSGYAGGQVNVGLANKTHSTELDTQTMIVDKFDLVVGEETGLSGDILTETLMDINNKVKELTINSEVSLIAPDGSKYLLIVDNSGDLQTVPLLPSNILYIGNSLLLGFITHGMASTTVNDDYYAKVNAYLEGKGKTLTTNRVSGISIENAVNNTTLQNALANLPLSNDIELVLVELGDNVNTIEKLQEFINGCKIAMSYIREHAPNARVAWCSTWYNRNEINKIIENACKEIGCVYIYISDIRGENVDNSSHIGATYIDSQGNEQTITEEGVASHPSDLGFTKIANRIISTLFE